MDARDRKMSLFWICVLLSSSCYPRRGSPRLWSASSEIPPRADLREKKQCLQTVTKQFPSITLRHFVTHETGIPPVKENTSKSEKTTTGNPPFLLGVTGKDFFSELIPECSYLTSTSISLY